jgi:hypothetical protein
MTQDFAKHSNIINDFRGQVLKNNFEHNFIQATEKIAKTERFLLKMELKRLAQPCMRLIDLRGLVDGECREYIHEKRIHFLDDIAIKVFEENILAYENYTFGVYEAVKNTENNFRVIYQKSKKQAPAPIKSSSPNKSGPILDKLQYPAQLYSFGPYYNRTEERMNFVISLSIEYSKTDKLTCTTSDLSINGCRFKTSVDKFITRGDLLPIRFTGLEEEFHFGDTSIFIYEVVNIERLDDVQFIGIKRVYQTGENKDGFSRFLTGFIQGNKRRYKINLDNSIHALQSRTFEQYVLPKVNELPVFINKIDDRYLPRYALTCSNNQSIYEYWLDDRKHSNLNILFSSKRIERLIKRQASGQKLIVYSFVHQSQGKNYFYSADEEQLFSDIDFMENFLGFAASKSSFMISELSLIEADVKFIEANFTLSESLTKKDVYLNQSPSKEVTELLSSLAYVGVVSDLTTPQVISNYQQYVYDDISVAKLKQCGHKRSVRKIELDRVGITYHDLRKEPRFFYNTPVKIMAEQVKWLGNSVDFSVSGMKIELQKAAVLMKGDIVYLSFPQLQKVTSKFDLTNLPYQIVWVNKSKTIINLKVHVEQHKHIGRAFFKLLIEKNKNKLTADEYVMMIPGLGNALRNLYSRSLQSLNLIIQTSGSRYKFDSLASNQSDSPFLIAMQALSDTAGAHNLYPLLNNIEVTDLLSNHLKKMQPADLPISEVIYIAININEKNINDAVSSKLATAFETKDQQQAFIKNALAQGQFFCIEMKLSRTYEPDMKHLNPELSYVGSYAIHRGKQLEQNIHSVAGVMQLFDITGEVMNRYRLNHYLLTQTADI